MKSANGGEPAPNGGLSDRGPALWLFAVPLVFYILGAAVGNSKLDQLINLPSFRREGPLIWKVRSDYIQGEWMGVALLFMVVVLLLLYLVTKSPLALGNLFMGGIMMESALRALIIHARASNLYEPGGIIMPWQTVAEYRADPLLESLQGWLIAVHLVGMAAFVWWWMARQRAKGGGRAARQVATPTEEN